MERKSTSVFLDEDRFSNINPRNASTIINNSPSKSKSSSSATCIRSWRYRWYQKFKTLCFILLAAANVGLSIWVVFFHGNLPEMFPGFYHTNSKLTQKKCHFPELNPFSQDIKHLLGNPMHINCPVAANSDYGSRVAFTTDRNNNLIRMFNPGIPCCYRPFYRTNFNDDDVWIESTKYHTYVCHNITQEVTKIPPEHEFIEVICKGESRSYQDGFSFAARKPKVEARIEEIQRAETEQVIREGTKPAERLSVIVFGFDSTSQLNFLRRMPKSVNFLNSVNAIKLQGYNKVGENTLPNVAPLLTGLHLDEFKDVCVEKKPSSDTAIHIDSCPFIWKDFAARGYRTSFAEDEVNTGIFNLYWSHAFINPPTDHYFRPFSLRMTSAHNSWEGICHGSKLGMFRLLDNLENLAQTYKNKDDLLFQFTWSSKLTHDDFNKLAWADRMFLRTLRFLYENGNLNNTALFLVGDHGSRKQELRQTRQGQLEDRMPLAYVVLPPWFESKYPLAMTNLKKNAQALTSTFDLYETFKDFMDLTVIKDPNVHYWRQNELKVAEHKGLRKGTSLFTALPDYRSCTTAGIPPHWCICYKKFPISTKSPEVYDAIGFIIRTLNNMILPYKQNCARLQWKKVTSVLKWHPEEAIENSFNGNADEENYKRSSLLQIAFQTKPGDGQFEVTVLHEPDNGWRLTEQVVRLDSHKEHSFCMHKEELKKICHCNQAKPKLIKDKSTKNDPNDQFINFP